MTVGGYLNRAQRLGLSISLVNLMLVLLFPPFDYVSLERGGVPTFYGFLFVLAEHGNRVVNWVFLALELLVVVINAGIVWWLFRAPAVAADYGVTGAIGGANRNQRLVAVLVAINLLLMVLFPPFENYLAITRATLPTFEGFFFIFGDHADRQIVTTILYIELILILVNGCLLWLLFRGREGNTDDDDVRQRLAHRMR